MKILFVCLSTLKFDVRTPDKEPLGGSESAVCYLSAELAKRGHEVTLASRYDKDGISLPNIHHGVHHMNVEAFNPRKSQHDFIIVINSLLPFPGLKMFSNSINILWNHMMPDQLTMRGINNPNMMASINHIVYVSKRQAEKYQIPNGRASIIENAIAPCFQNLFRSANELREAKECRGAYTSTPFRGLEHLAKIREIPIDVYSSMAVYQESDRPFIKLYEHLGYNPTIKMHGSVSQPELAYSLKRVAFLVYPCTFVECHSIAILEAQAAGCRIVTTETAIESDEFISVAKDITNFGGLLKENILYYENNQVEWSDKMFKQIQHINDNYTWSKRGDEWEILFDKLKTRKAA